MPFFNTTKGQLKTLLGSFILFLSFLPSLALAQGNIFEPAPGSKAMTVLASLFGDLGIFGSSGADAFVAPIAMFLGAILAVGGVLVAYTILAGTIGTAHDGELLGKKFSSIWIPVRTALGTALVLPVVGGGYCLMQLMVGWLVVQGIGMADKTWEVFVSRSNIGIAASAGLQRPEAKELVGNLFQSLVCVEVMNKAAASNAGQTLAPSATFGMSRQDNLTTVSFHFGKTAGNIAMAKDVCGTVEAAKFQAIATGGNSGGVIMNGVAAVNRMSAITQEHMSQLQALIASLQPLAKQLVDTNTAVSPALIDAAVSSYEEAVRTTAAAEILAIDAFKEVSENSSQDGFLMAGAFFIKISNMSDLINRSMANGPTASGAKTTGGGTFGDAYAQVYPAMMDTLKATKGGVANFGVGNEQGGSNTGWWDAVKDSASEGFNPTVLLKKAFTSSTNFVIQDGEHPLMAMKRMGNWLLGISGSAYATSVFLMSTAGNAPGVGLSIMMTALMTLPIFAITGFTLSYFLPMLPFLMWMGAVVGWMILVVEAILAAPIWAVMHLHPNGDDFVGKGGNGYNLVLSLMLRPVLMVFGFIASIILLQVVGQLINAIFADVFLVSQQDSSFFIWLGSFIAGPIIYCIVMFFIMKKMLTVMYMIPDQLLNWFSGGGAQLGRSAESIGGGQVYAAANIGMGQALGKGEMLNQMAKQGAELKSQGLVDKAQAEMGRQQNFDSMDKEMGSGASNIARFAEAQAGGPGSPNASYSMQKDMGMVSEGMSAVGGKDSLGGAAFMSRLNNSIEQNPNKSMKEHVASSVNAGLNENFGSGSGRVIGAIGKGYQGPEFNRAVQTFAEAKKTLTQGGMTDVEAKSTLSQVSKAAYEQYNKDSGSQKNGGSNTVQNYLATNLKDIAGIEPPKKSEE